MTPPYIAGQIPRTGSIKRISAWIVHTFRFLKGKGKGSLFNVGGQTGKTAF